jgi:hypothetical protein
MHHFAPIYMGLISTLGKAFLNSKHPETHCNSRASFGGLSQSKNLVNAIDRSEITMIFLTEDTRQGLLNYHRLGSAG